MPNIGLKHPVFAKILSESSGSLPTYGTGLIVGEAIEAKVAIEFANGRHYADDNISETDDGFSSGKITFSVSDLFTEADNALLGSQIKTIGGHSVIRDARSYQPPKGGYGYYRIVKSKGVKYIIGFWYYKTIWTRPSENAKTKADKIEYLTEEIEGGIFAVGDTDETWRDRVYFTTEADAVAWLHEHANIGTPASKTALNAAITSAQALDPEDYTSVSWVDTANALTEAVAVAAMELPSQVRVDSATSLLTTAVASLVTRA